MRLKATLSAGGFGANKKHSSSSDKQTSDDSFVPEKLHLRRGPSSRSSRRGHPDDAAAPSHNDETVATSVSTIKPVKSVIGKDEVHIVNTNFARKNSNRSIGSNNNTLSSSFVSTGSGIAASVIFAEDDELFDELDALDPFQHEGGRLATDPHASNTCKSTSLNQSAGSRSQSSRSHFSSILQSVQKTSHTSSLVSSGHFVPTDYESLMAASSTNEEGGVSDILGQIEDRHNANLTSADEGDQGSKRSSIVGGKRIADMSLQEKLQVLGINQSSLSVVDDGDDGNAVALSTVDWSSLTKSCKRAKDAFRDSDSGQAVVKNMFVSHLSALQTVMASYTKDHGDADWVKTRTSETKRALRFGMACLAPSREGESDNSTVLSSMAHSQIPTKAGVGTNFRDDVERYRNMRRYRQELQDAAVGEGLETTVATPIAEDKDEKKRRIGLQLPLVDIILGKRPNLENNVTSSIERDQQTTLTLAARLLCNLVTDNPVSAELVLFDVPFGPTYEEADKRMMLPLTDAPVKGVHHVICWSDIVTSTAKLGNSSAQDKDREALAAVAAALHNLLASLETRDSLIELDWELQRREKMKTMRARHRRSSVFGDDSDEDLDPSRPIDAGFEVASNRTLMNALLRNILPTKAVLAQSRAASFGEDNVGRPKFQAPASTYDHSHSFEDTSDSATEWISLVLERLASRGLLPQMFQSAGGQSGKGSVTPEQVVLISCIRQAVDDYHSARISTGVTGEFGRRRLSIAVKSAGVTVMTRPHPLWGRVDEEFGGGGISVGASSKSRSKRGNRIAPSSVIVPVLFFLSGEVERLRLRIKSPDPSGMYDGELSCTARVVDDIRDIVAQCLGKHAASPVNTNGSSAGNNKQCILSEARSVLGREGSVIQGCLRDLATIVDTALEKNSGKSARELNLTHQEQQSAIVIVRLIGNIVYQNKYNQDLLRLTQIPTIANILKADDGSSVKRNGLHVLLSATSLAPACFTLREWCIVAIRNAVENNEANVEAVQLLEANRTLGDTPELKKMGIKVDLDGKGKVRVQPRDSSCKE